eukprot:jgi/Mesen1/939/ME000118S00122
MSASRGTMKSQLANSPRKMSWFIVSVIVLTAVLLTTSGIKALPSAEPAGHLVYMVTLTSAPSVVQRAIAAPSLFPRLVGSSHKINFQSRASLSHAAALTQSHVNTLRTAGIPEERKIYRYGRLKPKLKYC